MRRITRLALAASALAMISASAAADPGPFVIEPEPVPEPPALAGGWYLRGDISYDFQTDANVVVSGVSSFDADFDDTWNVGFGLGYTFNDWFRADITADYRFSADWGAAATSISASTILLNGYATLGGFSGISPYVGIGAGIASVKWDTIDFPGLGLGAVATDDDWRFAYALMTGVSFDVTENLAVDTGYRFTGIDDGQLVDPGSIIVPGGATYSDLYIHEFRIGMRYTFGSFSGY
jgi:opacity protein-like surface antigen